LVGVFCWTNRWPLRQQLTLYAPLAPLLIFLSYPGMFLCGGLLVALLSPVWRERRAATSLGFIVLVLVVFASFAILLAGPVRAQDTGELRYWWVRYFPDWSRPWTVPFWAIRRTFDMFRYIVEPTGGLISPLAFLGAWVLWRGGKRPLALLLVVPTALGLVAACLGYYPWGHTRLVLYATPAVVLLTAAGLAPLLDWLSGPDLSRVAARLGLAVLLVAPAALSLERVVVPWEDRSADTKGATAYVLSKLRPTDAVRSNRWEQEYYLRGVRSRVRTPGEAAGDRLWVFITARDQTAWKEQVESLIDGPWRIIERREFVRTTVLLLGREHGAETEPPKQTSPDPIR
jgi:hypothetical protein